MSSPSPQQAIAPSYRTPIVLKAFCFGIAAGLFIAFCTIFSVTYYRHANLSSEGRDPTSTIVTNNDGLSIVSASSCDVFRGSTRTRETSNPIRFRAKLVRVVDGDTIRVMWHGESMSVRFLGIDAPEPRHPGGPESTECLRILLADAETVDLEFEGDTPRRDSLGRLLAYVWRDDTLLNLEMVKRGHAGLYKDGGKGNHGDALRHAIRTRSEKE